MYILAIRHGETLADLQSLKGVDDTPLSTLGRGQAQQLANVLRNQHGMLDAFLTSPLRRCRETADIVACSIGIKPESEPRLRNLDIGAELGLPKQQHEWFTMDTPYNVPFNGGESRSSLFHRVREVLEELGRLPSQGQALLVTHNSVLKAVEQYSRGCAFEDVRLNIYDTATVYRFVIRESPD